MQLKLIEKIQEASDCYSFIFQPEVEFLWIPGQYLKYYIDDLKADDRGNSRFFSIASSPDEKLIRLTTRFAEKSSTFKINLQNLKLGESIEAKGPMGSFILDPQLLDCEFIFIAGGIGITPFRSIICNLKNKQFPKISLLYSNRNEEIVFKNELEEIAKSNPLKINYFIGDKKIDFDYLKNNLDSKNSNIYYYISGPQPMVESFEKILNELGVNNEQVKIDYFPGYANF